MSFNPFHKLRNNIEAIRIALVYKPGDVLSGDDTAALRKYAGFGGIKAVLYPAGEKQEWEIRHASKADLQLYPSMMELHGLLSLAGEKAYRDSLEKQTAGLAESTQPRKDETYRKAKGVRL